VLDRAEVTAAADSLPRSHRGPSGAATPVERLLAEAREHLAAGRIGPAAERLHQARDLAPHDEEVAEELRRLGPFA
jgi:Flp pilus assembly protein TadD